MKKEKSLIKEFCIQVLRSVVICAASLIGMELAERIWLNSKIKKNESTKPKKKQVNEKTKEAVRNCIIYPWENE